MNSPAAEHGQRSGGWWQRWGTSALQLAGGIGVLGWVVWRFGTAAVVEGAGAVTPATVMASIAIGAVGVLANTQRWRLASAAAGHRWRLGDALLAYYQASFLNGFLPGGVVGDVLRTAAQHQTSTSPDTDAAGLAQTTDRRSGDGAAPGSPAEKSTGTDPTAPVTVDSEHRAAPGVDATDTGRGASETATPLPVGGHADTRRDPNTAGVSDLPRAGRTLNDSPGAHLAATDRLAERAVGGGDDRAGASGGRPDIGADPERRREGGWRVWLGSAGVVFGERWCGTAVTLSAAAIAMSGISWWWTLALGAGAVGHLAAAVLAMRRVRAATLAAMVGLSVVSYASFAGLFVVAARVLAPQLPLAESTGLATVAVAGHSIPVNVGGWGPREGITAAGFAAYGHPPELGVTIASGYGLLSLISTLPGAVALLIRFVPRRR